MAGYNWSSIVGRRAVESLDRSAEALDRSVEALDCSAKAARG